MFTGLIEEVGRVRWIRASEDGRQLQLTAPGIAAEARVGESVAVNGCCLTVATCGEDQLTFDLLEETLRCTNLGAWRRGDAVNLERALRADARLGGHFVQGHIDCTAAVIAFEESGADFRLEIALPENFSRYVVTKGSIAIDGISLTIAEVAAESFTTWIIPQTHRRTNLKNARAGARVNLEFDLLAKYVERFFGRA